MVLTSHDQLGNTRRTTGFWLEELAAPYYVFKDSGAEGGRSPLDPKSNEAEFQTDLTRRFEKDAAAEAQLDKTVRLDRVKQGSFDTVFYLCFHGPIWDLMLLRGVAASGHEERDVPRISDVGNEEHEY